MLIVVMSWPDDPDRGQEVYGPFESKRSQVSWTDEVLAAAEAGDALLSGCRLLLTKMDTPFEVQR